MAGRCLRIDVIVGKERCQLNGMRRLHRRVDRLYGGIVQLIESGVKAARGMGWAIAKLRTRLIFRV